MIQAHGGALIDRLCSDIQKNEILSRAERMPQITLTSSEVSDVYMIGTGAYSPLKGFMDQADYHRVVQDMRLSNGILWPLPVTLAIDEETKKKIHNIREVALFDAASKEIVAVMDVTDVYSYDKRIEAKFSFGTLDESHPGVEKLYRKKDYYLGGSLTVLSEGNYPNLYKEYARPIAVRNIIEENGWKRVAAFQTRNPIHRSHEYLTKIALEICDGMLIHPVVGKLKSDDVPAEVRIKCYRTLLNKYYPKDRTLLKVYPMEMRYAGPKEAILHAIIRQNFGCTDIIIGRDHAGVGRFYGPFEAQDIFDEIPYNDLQIQPMKIDWTFWCRLCGGMASTKTCPHEASAHVLISGTEVRKMLAEGVRPPLEYTRKEVADILMEYYSKRHKI